MAGATALLGLILTWGSPTDALLVDVTMSVLCALTVAGIRLPVPENNPALSIASLRLPAIGLGTAVLMPLVGRASAASPGTGFASVAVIMMVFALCAAWVARAYRPRPPAVERQAAALSA